MKPTNQSPVTFKEALATQESLLDSGTKYLIVDTPKGDYSETVFQKVSRQSEEIVRLRKHAQRWQAAFSLTAVLAIWLIAMRFV